MEKTASGVQQVLSCLLEQTGAITRPAVAEACALSRPTVFSAMDRLEALGVVEQVGQSTGKPGRSPVLYQVARGAGLLAAVDIGGSNVRVAVTDVRGCVLAELREPTVPGGGERILEQVATLLEGALRSLAPSPSALTLVAVSIPGVVATDGSTVHYASNIDQPTPFDFRTPLQERLATTVVLENNVNLAAVGERWQGGATDLATFAVVAVGAGIGAGIMHEGRLIRGAHGAAGEVAFLPPDGRTRRINATAHDEAGGLTLLRTARARAGWEGGLPGTVEEIFERARAGEEPAVALVEEECLRVATIIAAVCAVVDPEKVILTGGVGSNEQLISRTETLTAEMTIFPPPVVRAGLGERASLIGAIRLAALTAKRQLLGSVQE
ncbi:MAG: ROK family protein [Nocardioidaceae bacterium]